MQCIGDLIVGDSKNRDLLASKVLGEEPQVEPALNSILRILLRTSNMQEFIAADYIFKSFCEVGCEYLFLDLSLKKFLFTTSQLINFDWCVYMLFTTYLWFLLLPWLNLSKTEKCWWSINAGVYINSTAIFNESCIPWGGCQYVFWQVCFVGGALMTPLPFDACFNQLKGCWLFLFSMLLQSLTLGENGDLEVCDMYWLPIWNVCLFRIIFCIAC